MCLQEVVLASTFIDFHPRGWRDPVAIYHYSVQVFSRSHGHSAVAAAAYRAGANLHDERTGEDHRYGNRTGVIESLILAPDGSSDWTQDRSRLWNTTEQSESRKDAQLAREVVLALPCDLPHAQRRDLLEGFAQEQYVKNGMVADISYHAPDANGDHRNYHAHVMLTLRPLNEQGDGFAAKKNRDWNTKAVLLEQRQAWADHMNRALERAGIDERVDERSFVDRDINRVPSVHMGKAATEMQRRDEPSRIGDENAAAQLENWNRELAELEQDEKIINLAIEREKRRMAAARQQQPASAHQPTPPPSRPQAQGFQSDHAIPTLQAERLNALHLRQLDERRALEATIARRRLDMEATGQRFYQKEATQEALAKAQDDLRSAQTFMGRLTGRDQAAQARVDALRLNLEDIDRRQGERAGFFERQAAGELHALEQRHKQEAARYVTTPEQDHGTESEDMRDYGPDQTAPPSSRAANDNDRSSDVGPSPDHGPSMDR